MAVEGEMGVLPVRSGIGTAFAATRTESVTAICLRLVLRIALVIAAVLALTSHTAVAQSGNTSDNVAETLQALSPIAADDVLWLARCIYSESDRAHEQRLVAWVVRNRVETQFRGRTYREVVLEARQFSAFNDPTPRRRRILNLTATSPYGPWQSALAIALDVYTAPRAERPFPVTVRHFYSPISMRGGLEPHWADSGTEIAASSLGTNPMRFRFFNNVDEAADVGLAANETAPSSRQEADEDDDDGFLFPIRQRSGRIARPKRPSTRPVRR